MSSNRVNQQDRILRDQKMIEGIKKHLKSASIVVAGKTYTSDEVVAALQARVDAANAIAPAKAAWQDLVNTATTQTEQSKSLVSGLRQTVKVMFGQTAETLADFGIPAPKPRKVLTSEEKVAAAAKAAATRAARHTMGKVQKAKVKGSAPSTSSSGPAQPAPK